MGIGSVSKKGYPEIERNIFTTCPEALERVVEKGTSFVGRGLFILFLFAAVLLAGCSTPEMTATQQAIPEESEFAYSISISAPPIQISGGNLQISGGNLHWHKKLPNNTYILEDAAIEIYNFGDFDILVAQLEMRVDKNSRLFNVDMVIPGKTRESLAVQPMMEGYDGGTHIVHVVLLDENGEILYESDGHEIGPLEPIPGTGSWKQAQNY